MNRRNFLTFSLAAGFSSLALGTASSTDSQPLQINIKLSKDTEHLQERFERFFPKNQKNSFSDLEGRFPLQFKVNVLDGKSMLPLADAKVGIFLSDAFKSCNKLSGCSNKFNIAWEETSSVGAVVFESRFPSPVFKHGKLINPVDFVVVNNNSISVSRLDIISDSYDVATERKSEIYARTLTDRALQITGQALSKPAAYLVPVKVNNSFEAAIDFIIDNA